MLDTGYWMLDAGCSILDAGYSMLDTAGARLTAIECWILDVSTMSRN
jgi:hypothetical protein